MSDDINDTIDNLTITLNNDTIVDSGYSGVIFANSTIGSNSYPYTISAGTGLNNPWSTTVSPKIRLDGEGADIEVNGVSLMDMIGKIEQRLNILHPNEKLEAEWDELRELGDQYRRLEQHIQEKQATWDRLKAMPPPVVE